MTFLSYVFSLEILYLCPYIGNVDPKHSRLSGFSINFSSLGAHKKLATISPTSI